jgi:hypothetical protein
MHIRLLIFQAVRLNWPVSQTCEGGLCCHPFEHFQYAKYFHARLPISTLNKLVGGCLLNPLSIITSPGERCPTIFFGLQELFPFSVHRSFHSIYSDQSRDPPLIGYRGYREQFPNRLKKELYLLGYNVV